MRISSALSASGIVPLALSLSTLSSTIISSTCSLGPSSFNFQNGTIPALSTHKATSLSSDDEIIYETGTLTNDFTTHTTLCDKGGCFTTDQHITLTTTTATVGGVLTTYVSAVPVTSATPNPESSSVPTSSEEDTTSTIIQTTYVTRTSCSDGKCSTSAVPTGLTTGTSTVNGVETLYTTYCPLSSAAAEKTSSGSSSKTPKSNSSTLITVTSCDQQNCATSSYHTGVTQYTTTVHGLETVFTTYCPLSTETPSPSSAPEAPTSTATTPAVSTTPSTSFAPHTLSKVYSSSAPTVNVITNNIVTQSSSSSAASGSTSAPVISTYEAAAGRALPLFFGALPLVYMLF